LSRIFEAMNELVCAEVYFLKNVDLI